MHDAVAVDPQQPAAVRPRRRRVPLGFRHDRVRDVLPAPPRRVERWGRGGRRLGRAGRDGGMGVVGARCGGRAGARSPFRFRLGRMHPAFHPGPHRRGDGLVAGPIGLVVAYLATYWLHGAANPVHYGLVHRNVESEHRATVISANSLTSQVGGAISGIALGALADSTSIGDGDGRRRRGPRRRCAALPHRTEGSGTRPHRHDVGGHERPPTLGRGRVRRSVAVVVALDQGVRLLGGSGERRRHVGPGEDRRHRIRRRHPDLALRTEHRRQRRPRPRRR